MGHVLRSLNMLSHSMTSFVAIHATCCPSLKEDTLQTVSQGADTVAQYLTVRSILTSLPLAARHKGKSIGFGGRIQLSNLGQLLNVYSFPCPTLRIRKRAPLIGIF